MRGTARGSRRCVVHRPVRRVREPCRRALLRLAQQLAQQSLAQQKLDLAAQAALEDAKGASERGESSVVLEVNGLDGKELQKLVTKVQKASPAVAVAAFSVNADKVFAYSSVPKELQPALPASEWLKGALEAIGGRGGGKAASAQGSGADVSAVGAAKQAAADFAAAATAKASA